MGGRLEELGDAREARDGAYDARAFALPARKPTAEPCTTAAPIAKFPPLQDKSDFDAYMDGTNSANNQVLIYMSAGLIAFVAVCIVGALA